MTVMGEVVVLMSVEKEVVEDLFFQCHDEEELEREVEQEDHHVEEVVGEVDHLVLVAVEVSLCL